MERKKYFMQIFRKAEKKFGSSSKRLAGDSWPEAWQTLIATILSAQSRDEVTIPIAENLFKKYTSLEKLSNAEYEDVLSVLKSINYNKTKTKNVINAAKFIIENFVGSIPDSVDELVKIPGVGRKTANLVITEVHNKDGICVDTHVHRISNVLGIVNTKTPEQTEKSLEVIVPKKYWRRINRLFVLWGKAVPGRNRRRLLKALK